MQEYYDITIYSLKIHGKDKHLFRIMNENSALMLLFNIMRWMKIKASFNFVFLSTFRNFAGKKEKINNIKI